MYAPLLKGRPQMSELWLFGDETFCRGALHHPQELPAVRLSAWAYLVSNPHSTSSVELLLCSPPRASTISQRTEPIPQ